MTRKTKRNYLRLCAEKRRKKNSVSKGLKEGVLKVLGKFLDPFFEKLFHKKVFLLQKNFYKTFLQKKNFFTKKFFDNLEKVFQISRKSILKNLKKSFLKNSKKFF